MITQKLLDWLEEHPPIGNHKSFRFPGHDNWLFTGGGGGGDAYRLHLGLERYDFNTKGELLLHITSLPGR